MDGFDPKSMIDTPPSPTKEQIEATKICYQGTRWRAQAAYRERKKAAKMSTKDPDENPPTPVQTPVIAGATVFNPRTMTPLAPRQLLDTTPDWRRMSPSARVQASIDRRRMKREAVLTAKEKFLKKKREETEELLNEKKEDSQQYDREEDQLLLSQLAEEGLPLKRALYLAGITDGNFNDTFLLADESAIGLANVNGSKNPTIDFDVPRGSPSATATDHSTSSSSFAIESRPNPTIKLKESDVLKQLQLSHLGSDCDWNTVGGPINAKVGHKDSLSGGDFVPSYVLLQARVHKQHKGRFSWKVISSTGSETGFLMEPTAVPWKLHVLIDGSMCLNTNQDGIFGCQYSSLHFGIKEMKKWKESNVPFPFQLLKQNITSNPSPQDKHIASVCSHGTLSSDRKHTSFDETPSSASRVVDNRCLPSCHTASTTTYGTTLSDRKRKPLEGTSSSVSRVANKRGHLSDLTVSTSSRGTVSSDQKRIPSESTPNSTSRADCNRAPPSYMRTTSASRSSQATPTSEITSKPPRVPGSDVSLSSAKKSKTAQSGASSRSCGKKPNITQNEVSSLSSKICKTTGVSTPEIPPQSTHRSPRPRPVQK